MIGLKVHHKIRITARREQGSPHIRDRHKEILTQAVGPFMFKEVAQAAHHSRDRVDIELLPGQ
jgi:hypothetical protein